MGVRSPSSLGCRGHRGGALTSFTYASRGARARPRTSRDLLSHHAEPVEPHVIVQHVEGALARLVRTPAADGRAQVRPLPGRSEEHTSELQSWLHLVCRL